MLLGADHDRQDRVLAKRPAGLQAVQSGNQHITFIAAAHADRYLKALVQNALGKRFDICRVDG